MKNQRLAATGYTWAFCALTRSPGAEPTSTNNARPTTAAPPHRRNLFNRLLGCLYHRLTTGQRYAEATAFPTPDTELALAA